RSGDAGAPCLAAGAEAALDGTRPRRRRGPGVPLLAASAIAGARGRRRGNGVDVAPAAGGTVQALECDLVCVSGGYTPAIQLFAQARGAVRYHVARTALLPEQSPGSILAEGAANGRTSLADSLADGPSDGLAVARWRGIGLLSPPRAAPPEPVGETHALWSILPRAPGLKRFVDLQNDVTVDDIVLAAREGYASVEHLKRYTTLGMGTDQGKTSNLIGLALLAEATGREIADVGTTTFRPPYTPVSLGAYPGQHCGVHVEPTRYSAMHDWHAARGAGFVNAGHWKRPHSYPRAGESPDDAAAREARSVRTGVGVVDVSTLGKIEIQGRDAAEFLNRVYANRWDTLPIGRCRYGVMLREDGIVLDDG